MASLDLEAQARVDLCRVERRRKLLADAEARLARTAQAVADANGYRMTLTEAALRRLLSSLKIAA
jgi:hypothetical protein